MKPLACALDVLQGDKHTHSGYILPTLSVLVRRIEYEIMSGLKHCVPLAQAVLDGIHKRCVSLLIHCEHFCVGWFFLRINEKEVSFNAGLVP